MKIGVADCQNLDRASTLEWLETNGRGGFSSGTVAGANTRRYHALLLTARKPPGERAGVTMELVPGNGKGLFGKGHRFAHSGDAQARVRDRGMHAELAGMAGRWQAPLAAAPVS